MSQTARQSLETFYNDIKTVRGAGMDLEEARTEMLKDLNSSHWKLDASEKKHKFFVYSAKKGVSYFIFNDNSLTFQLNYAFRIIIIFLSD